MTSSHANLSSLSSCNFSKARSCKQLSISSLRSSVSPRPHEEADFNLQEWVHLDQDQLLPYDCASWNTSALTDDDLGFDASGNLDFLLFPTTTLTDYDFTDTINKWSHRENNDPIMQNFFAGPLEVASTLFPDTWQALSSTSSISDTPSLYGNARSYDTSPISLGANMDYTHSSSTMPQLENGSASKTSSPKKRTAAEPLNSSSRSPSLGLEDTDQVNKRQRNTEAARRYRQRKVDRQTELEEALASMTKERDDLRLKLARSEAEAGVLRGMVSKKS